MHFSYAVASPLSSNASARESEGDAGCAGGRVVGDRAPAGKDARRGELPEMEGSGDLRETVTTLGPQAT
jgi:hypothetical protein